MFSQIMKSKNMFKCAEGYDGTATVDRRGDVVFTDVSPRNG